MTVLSRGICALHHSTKLDTLRVPTVREGLESSDSRQPRAELAPTGKISLQLRATLEKVTNLRPMGGNFWWYLEVKCRNCGELSEKWQCIRLRDSVALREAVVAPPWSRVQAVCEGNSAEILSSSSNPYNVEDNEKFKTIVEFECWSLEPVDFQVQAGFAAEGVEPRTIFSDNPAGEGLDYDEKAWKSVRIYEVTHQFVRC